MNKDNVRKHIADIQIAMGKILQEMDGFQEVAEELAGTKAERFEKEKDTIVDILAIPIVTKELTADEAEDEVLRSLGMPVPVRKDV